MSHTSAVEFWRLATRNLIAGLLQTERKDVTILEECIPTDKDICAIRALLSTPATYIELLVPTAKTRRRSKDVVSHVAPHTLPNNAFIRVGKDLFVCSPELCFVQMATILTLAELIQFGCELCGAYRRPFHKPTRYNQAPLTSVIALQAFLDECKGLPGLKNARRALCYITINSASPMETILIMLLCLPLNLGGYGLPTPQHNYRIDFPRNKRTMCSKNYYVCDLYWPDALLAIEYDSDLSHTDSESITLDASKRNELSYLGIDVITVTRLHILNWAHMERIAELITKRLHRRKRNRGSEFPNKQYMLRRELLNFSQS